MVSTQAQVNSLRPCLLGKFTTELLRQVGLINIPRRDALFNSSNRRKVFIPRHVRDRLGRSGQGCRNSFALMLLNLRGNRPVSLFDPLRARETGYTRHAPLVIMYQQRVIKSEDGIRLIGRASRSRLETQTLKAAREVIRESSDAGSPVKSLRGLVPSDAVLLEPLVQKRERIALYRLNAARQMLLYTQARAVRFNRLKGIEARDEETRRRSTRPAAIENAQTPSRMKGQQGAQESVYSYPYFM